MLQDSKHKRVTDPKERVVIVGVTDQKTTASSLKRSFDELAGLINTAGGEVVASVCQEIKSPNPATFIGKGKVKELAMLVLEKKADLVAVDFGLTPVQNRNLEKELSVRVADRSAVILDIFAMRARTREGKLQVELAQLEYLAPRLIGRGKMLSQQAGRIGTRGPGETELEYDRRNIKKRITRLKRKIDLIRLRRKVHRAKRKGIPIPVAAIIGYTNAGKSTLMNALTQAGLFVEDKLFATLDPTIRCVKLPTGRQMLLSDTVGFIDRLPLELAAAFKATFEEIADADILLKVIDVSNPDAETQSKVVDRVLFELNLNHKPSVLVQNKCDLGGCFFNDKDGVNISALTKVGLDELVRRIDELLRRDLVHMKLALPHTRGDILSRIYEIGRVHKCRHGGDGVFVDCELPEKYAMKYRQFKR